jgi:hypothetical protein
MIDGYCRTNLDNYQMEVWPEIFVAVPRVGECIESKSGKVLKVVRITHQTYTEEVGLSHHKLMPRIAIELHKVIGG